MRVLNIYKGVQDKGMHLGTPTIFVDVVGSKSYIVPNPLNDITFKQKSQIDLGSYDSGFPYHLCAQSTFHLAEKLTPVEVTARVLELTTEPSLNERGGWSKNDNDIHLCFNFIDAINHQEVVQVINGIRRHCNINKLAKLRTVVFNIHGNSLPSLDFLKALHQIDNTLKLMRTFTALFQIVTHDSVGLKYDDAELRDFIYGVIDRDHRIAFLNEVLDESSLERTLKIRRAVLDLIPKETDRDFYSAAHNDENFLRDRIAYVLRVAKFYAFSNTNPDIDLIDKCFEYGLCYHPVPINSLGKYHG